MKTLEEVIEMQRRILMTANLPEDDTTTSVGMSLYYLREYHRQLSEQTLQNALNNLNQAIDRYNEAVKNLEAAENKYKLLAEEAAKRMSAEPENKPLNWYQLQAMIGKPIWLELLGSGKGEWVLLTDVMKDAWFIYRDGVEINLNRTKLGKTWLAYRKETNAQK